MADANALHLLVRGLIYAKININSPLVMVL